MRLPWLRWVSSQLEERTGNFAWQFDGWSSGVNKNLVYRIQQPIFVVSNFILLMLDGIKGADRWMAGSSLSNVVLKLNKNRVCGDVDTTEQSLVVPMLQER